MASTFADVPPSPAHPLQNLNELRALWEYVAARPHARVLEIGSLYGGTLWYWSHLPSIETLVSVDLLPDDAEARNRAWEARQHWQEWFSTPRLAFTEMIMDSHDADLAAWTRLSHGLFDFVFLDGDHSYEGVSEDWLLWTAALRPGGVVALHDTWPNFDRHEPGVVRWVDELRHQLPSIEWTDPDGVGICAFVVP